jgi:hypothetical protein
MGDVAIGPTLLSYMGNELYIWRPMGFEGLARSHRLHAPWDGPAGRGPWSPGPGSAHVVSQR